VTAMTREALLQAAKEWEAALADHTQKVIDAAALTGEIPIIDVVTFLDGCPAEVRRLISERARAKSADGVDRARREAHTKTKAAQAAERLAALLDGKGKEAEATAQRLRAAALYEEAARIYREVLP